MRASGLIFIALGGNDASKCDKLLVHFSAEQEEKYNEIWREPLSRPVIFNKEREKEREGKESGAVFIKIDFCGVKGTRNSCRACCNDKRKRGKSFWRILLYVTRFARK